MHKPRALLIVLALVGALEARAQTAIPPDYALPAGSVDTTKPGFRVHPYATTTTHGGNLAWSFGQLAGAYGPNIADNLTGADAQGNLLVPTVVNWNITAGGTVDTFPGADPMPGLSTVNVNFTEDVATYIEFPAAGTYTMGVNSDDGFGVYTSKVTPKDSTTAIQLGAYDGTRGTGDTTFSFSVTAAGIYPFRLIYFQAGGGASVTWFSVMTNTTSTNFVMINDTSTPGALKAYSTAKVAPPYVGGFVHSPAGFAFTITDDVSALATNTLQVKLNGSAVPVTLSKSGAVTTATYSASPLFAPGVTNNVAVQFSDNATPPYQGTANFSFAEGAYAAMPASAALPATAVDTTKRGFVYRLNQIDSTTPGILAANVAHAEAQLCRIGHGCKRDALRQRGHSGDEPRGDLPDQRGKLLLRHDGRTRCFYERQ